MYHRASAYLNSFVGSPDNSTSRVPRPIQRQSSIATTSHRSQPKLLQRQSSIPATPANRAQLPPAVRPDYLSEASSYAVPDSLWFTSDIQLGAGMAIIQPSTGKVVILSQKVKAIGGKDYTYWFLPKGRKDVGESLEQTALREAYEESGMRVSFLPLIIPHNAPNPPDSIRRLDKSHVLPSTEPIYVSVMHCGRKRDSVEYLTFWHVGQIPADAIVESGTRMPDEVGYETHLVSFNQALNRLGQTQGFIMSKAYMLWQETIKLQANPEYQQYFADITSAYAKSERDKASSTGAGEVLDEVAHDQEDED